MLLLSARGNEVCGLALDPEPSSLYQIAGIADLMASDVRGDVRDSVVVQRTIHQAAPDVVVHMAAQPLVRDSYSRPRWTMETNVMGTLNVLEAVSSVSSVRAHVMVTTDKVYLNVGQTDGYVETDTLGAGDPYSTSKAMADLLVQSWIASFDGPPTAIARAGNVLGGGDTSSDRLMPDLLAAFAEGRPAELRYPDAVRPWQHVLDCLNGYVCLVDALLTGSGGGAWNFGPDRESFRTVREVATIAAEIWGEGASWQESAAQHPHEASVLSLDSGKAHSQLGWRNLLGLRDTISATVEWQKWVDQGVNPREAALRQIHQFYEASSD